MSYSNGENPGAPYGARWDDGYPAGPAPRAERYSVMNPWAATGCGDCKEAVRRGSSRGGCSECVPVTPISVLPGAPGPDDQLGCTGRWDLFDTELPGEEALSLCASCPFKDWCLATATANRERGTWAGTTYVDRQPKRQKEAA